MGVTMGVGTLAVVRHVPGGVARWVMARTKQAVRSAGLQSDVRCLAELCRCLEGTDEGYVFHAPFLVIKGRGWGGRTRLFAARLTPAEVDEFRRGRPLPEAAGRFIQSLRPVWRRVLGRLAPGRFTSVPLAPGRRNAARRPTLRGPVSSFAR
jgi:hypothetical protein